MTSTRIEGALALAPEVALVLTACGVLAALLFSGSGDARRPGWTALVGLGATAAWLIARTGHAPQTVFAMIEVDGFAAFFKLLMSLGGVVVLLLWMSDRPHARTAPREAFFLLPAALLGGFVMVGTNHALILVLGFELLSLASHALASSSALRAPSSEETRRFVVRSGLASALMVYGVSLLYGSSGTLDLERMGAGDVASGSAGLAQQLAIDPFPVALALSLVLVGFLSKIALTPFAVAAADVGDGPPAGLCAFFAIVPSAAGLGAILRASSALFVQDGLAPAMAPHAVGVGSVLAVTAALTMTLGNLAALRQTGWKRLFACASIAQLGLALIGAASMNETGFAAALVHVAVSALSSAGAFVLLWHFEGLGGSDRPERLRGLGWRSPVAGAGLLVLLGSWVGLPPSAGFYAKVRLSVEGWNAGLDWLVLVAAINSLFTASFVLSVARTLFTESSAAGEPARARPLVAFAVGLSIAVLALGLWTRALDRWANSGLDLLRGSL